MAVTLYPTLHEALLLHDELVRRFGGSEGVRDLGALESALHRPQSGYYDRLSLQAAALMHSMAMNHAFVDGNKRMALALTAVFLRMNGQRLVASADEAVTFVVEWKQSGVVGADKVRMSTDKRAIHGRNDLLEIRDGYPTFLEHCSPPHRKWYLAHTPLICDFLLSRLSRRQMAEHACYFTILHDLVGSVYGYSGFNGGDIQEAWESVSGALLVEVAGTITDLPPSVDIGQRTAWWLPFLGHLGKIGFLKESTTKRIAVEVRLHTDRRRALGVGGWPA